MNAISKLSNLFKGAEADSELKSVSLSCKADKCHKLKDAREDSTVLEKPEEMHGARCEATGERIRSLEKKLDNPNILPPSPGSLTEIHAARAEDHKRLQL